MSFVCVKGAMVAGRYKLLRLIGEGGMGSVWAATHLVTRRMVALKFLKGMNEARPEVRRRFLREARAASVLRHPNVVQVHDILELEGGAPAMVLDLLEGETLGERLGREKTVPLDELARILVPVVSAVGTAHAAGIVHRDLKPDNIFLVRLPDGGCDVRVLDFGIAKLTATEGDLAQTGGLTRTGDMVGTPYYMSPEQAFGEHDVDHRADIWALGVILHECLVGRRPFQGDNIGQILKRIMTSGPVRLDEEAPRMPRDITQLVGRMLAHERSQRPANLLEVAEVLARHTDARAQSFGEALQRTESGRIVIGGTPVSVQSGRPPDETDPLARTTAAHPRAPAPWLWAVVAVTLLGVASAVGWWWGRPAPPASPPATVVAPTAVAPAPAPVAPAPPSPAAPVPAITAAPARAPTSVHKSVATPSRAHAPKPRTEPVAAPPPAAPARKPLPGGVVDQVPF